MAIKLFRNWSPRKSAASSQDIPRAADNEEFFDRVRQDAQSSALFLQYLKDRNSDIDWVAFVHIKQECKSLDFSNAWERHRFYNRFFAVPDTLNIASSSQPRLHNAYDFGKFGTAAESLAEADPSLAQGAQFLNPRVMRRILNDVVRNLDQTWDGFLGTADGQLVSQRLGSNR